jgi:diaminopimelate decarboxylase
MDFFEYRAGELCCEQVPVRAIAKAAGTPLYIYSAATLERHFRVFQEAFREIPHVICYSCKANANLAILRTLSGLGAGADIVSGGELFKALTAGVPAERIVFSGVGKTEDELSYAIRSRILMINIESAGELQTLVRISRRMKTKVPVSIRVNPQIDPKTHPYITTGLRKNKFGVLWSDAEGLYGEIGREPFLEARGISSHIGSQILDLEPFVDAVSSLKEMIKSLGSQGMHLTHLDIGGGLGITYKDELPPHPAEYATVIAGRMKETGLTLIMEPGRVLVGNSGIFVTKVLYVKKSGGKTFYVVDGAMNDLVRPALYNAYHEILPVKHEGEAKVEADIVGPICESGDFLAKDRQIGTLRQGDLLAVKGAGAYGFSMSSNYNARRRAPEVLVRGGDFYIVRKRESLKDLIRNEVIPPYLEVQ